MLEGWFTRQLLFDGLITGMVFGLVAMGIVLIYRSTRVINFAVANIGFLGAGIFALLVAQWNVPFWLAAVIGIALGHPVRRRRRAGRHPPAVQRAARDRAGRDHRHRAALPGDPRLAARDRRARRAVPVADRRR